VRRPAGFAALAVLGFALPVLAADKADRIFINGVVWTGDPALPKTEAIAVRQTLIMGVGTTNEIRKLAEKTTDVIDLKGRFVYPGFNDAHLHLMGGSLSLDEVDLAGAIGTAALQQRLAAYAKAHPDRPWITGRGWAYGDLGTVPHRKILDAVVSDRPVWIDDRDGHSGWANTKALDAAGVTRITKDPEHGVVVRDETGEPSGLMKESAKDLIAKHVPVPTADEKYRALKKGVELLASYGLTSVQDAGTLEGDPAGTSEENLPVFDRLMAENALKVRVYGALPFVKDPSPALLAHYRELQERHKSPRLRLLSVKGFVDGVVDAKTAVMLEPFVGGGNGILNWKPEELNRTAAAYDKERYQIRLHAIGDQAIRLALDAFESAARANGALPGGGRRHRVEHAEVPSPADRARFKALGVVASTQALFANPDKTTLENYAVLLGPQRAAQANAFKLFDDAGAVQAFGSDWPVFSSQVLRGIYCAVTRTTPEGTPAGGWYPENRISAEAALRHFTRDAAYASFEEQIKGTLGKGKLADLVILSDDILGAPPERILKAKVLLTVMGGQDTYRAREF
jgi:predicted amidohydrolase YtcJ